jgi:CDGSH-type Zn-finger protein
MTWSFGRPLATDERADAGTVALCRCGRSGDRPFCDGSHLDHDWDATDADRPDRPYAERARRIEGTRYTLLDDTPLCMHAGLCGTERRTVWQMVPDTDDTEVRGTVVRMVEKCPSGRLTNVVDGTAVEPALPAEVNVVPGGPLWITGGIPVRDTNGDELEIRNRVTLCRCGASDSKPLCDGSHDEIGFEREDSGPAADGS